MNRTLFCTYWLYFNAFRGILDRQRILDYVAMCFLALGLIFINKTGLNLRLMGRVTILMSPLLLAAILDPSIYIALFVFKTCLVILYLVGYFELMRLTIVELACFSVPVILNVYFFFNPDAAIQSYLINEGRMAGITEPNFTSLSLIYSLCGAFGIYVLGKNKASKLLAIVIVLVCSFGVVLTGSRAGFISVTLALFLFLVMENKLRHPSVVATLVGTIIAFELYFPFLHRLVLFERFQGYTRFYNPDNFFSGRDRFWELAWNSIQRGDWFIGGGPQRLSEWGRFSLDIPHNSILDIGIEFGKASFYFYGLMFVVFVALNVVFIVRNRGWREREDQRVVTLLASLLFLSMAPMYLSLSTGMSMTFLVWMVLGAYPLLHKPPKLRNLFRRL